MAIEIDPIMEDGSIPPASSSTSQPLSHRRTAKEKSSKGGTKKVRKVKKKKSTTDEHNKLIKYGSLLLLVAQMAGLVLLMRYTRTHAVGDKGEIYLASTAVFFQEVMKFIICLCVELHRAGSGAGLLTELYRHVWASPVEMGKLCVPSLLYTVQNNLLYLALTNLDAATYQVCYQLKILTTAVFSTLLLKRTFSRTKWTAIVILTAGVAVVQTSGSGDKHGTEAVGDKSAHQRFIGMVAVLCAACTSGFSGVYFEKILKGSSTSLWIRNIQMGLPSIIIAYVTVYLHDASSVAERGFFGGYNAMVWTVVTVQAAGGLIVAVVVKYADNVLKTFAASFSIIVSCIVSAFLFDFRPNFQFILGTALVLGSTVMYSRPDRKRRRKKQVLPMTMTVKDASRTQKQKSGVVA